MREGWDDGSRFAGMGPAEWSNWHRVDCSIEIVPSQFTGVREIDHRVGKSGSGENRSRDLPSAYQVIGAAAVDHGFYRELPHIVRIQRVTNIVICGSIAAPQMKGVLRKVRTACSEFGLAAVGNFIQSVAVCVVCLKQTIAETRESPSKGKNHAKEIEDAKLHWAFDINIIPSITDREGVILKLTNIKKRVV